MQNFKVIPTLRLIVFMVTATLALAPIRHSTAIAQEPGQNLAGQLSELQAKVARLEAALNRQSGGSSTAMPQQNDAANMQGMAGMAAADSASSQIPPGFQLSAGYQNCLQCHRTRPTGPLPPTHLVRISNDSAGGNAGGAQGGSTTQAGGQPNGGTSSQIPPGFQLNAGYQNCVQCHGTRPSGPLPQSHLVRISNDSAGGNAGGAQSGSTAAAGGQSMAGGGMGMAGSGMGMGKGMMGGGMGKGMMGGGMGMGKGMMGGGMGMGGMSSGSGGMGGDSGGMGGNSGGGMSGSSGGTSDGSGKPDMSSMGDAGGTNAAMSGTGAVDQLQQMQQQMQMMMQMQMMQMKVMEMQMKMMQMKQ